MPDHIIIVGKFTILAIPASRLLLKAFDTNAGYFLRKAYVIASRYNQSSSPVFSTAKILSQSVSVSTKFIIVYESRLVSACI